MSKNENVPLPIGEGSKSVQTEATVEKVRFVAEFANIGWGVPEIVGLTAQCERTIKGRLAAARERGWLTGPAKKRPVAAGRRLSEAAAALQAAPDDELAWATFWGAAAGLWDADAARFNPKYRVKPDGPQVAAQTARAHAADLKLAADEELNALGPRLRTATDVGRHLGARFRTWLLPDLCLIDGSESGEELLRACLACCDRCNPPKDRVTVDREWNRLTAQPRFDPDWEALATPAEAVAGRGRKRKTAAVTWACDYANDDVIDVSELLDGYHVVTPGPAVCDPKPKDAKRQPGAEVIRLDDYRKPLAA